MKITIGSTTFGATRCTRRRDNTKGFYLDIAVPVENISKDALYDLLDGNTENIIVTEDDGSESTYKGFNKLMDFSVSKGSILVAQYCTCEMEAQLSIAQNKIEAQNKTIAALQNEAAALTNEILSQAEVIVAQGETIATQNEQVAALMEASTSQLDAIDSIMTEVIPMVAAEAASMAVEQALAAISEKETTTEEETPVEETPVEETTEEI